MCGCVDWVCGIVTLKQPVILDSFHMVAVWCWLAFDASSIITHPSLTSHSSTLSPLSLTEEVEDVFNGMKELNVSDIKDTVIKEYYLPKQVRAVSCCGGGGVGVGD